METTYVKPVLSDESPETLPPEAPADLAPPLWGCTVSWIAYPVEQVEGQVGASSEVSGWLESIVEEEKRNTTYRAHEGAFRRR